MLAQPYDLGDVEHVELDMLAAVNTLTLTVTDGAPYGHGTLAVLLEGQP